MKINWAALSEKEDVRRTLIFQKPSMPAFFRRGLSRQYPEIDSGMADKMTWVEYKKYLQEKLIGVHRKNQDKIDARVKECAEYCSDEKMREVSAAFSDAFGVNCHEMFNNISGEIGINTVCPRWIQDDASFSVPFYRTKDDILQVALHEMVHFVWFRLWHEHFKDSWDEYEQPHLKWLLSEMIVDPIIRYSDLSKFYPDIDNNRDIAYYYFYDMKICGAPILETLANFYKNNSITDCMEKSYKYCEAHEKELRAKIAEIENRPSKPRMTDAQILQSIREIMAKLHDPETGFDGFRNKLRAAGKKGAEYDQAKFAKEQDMIAATKMATGRTCSVLPAGML